MKRKRHIKLFQTHSEYEEFVNSEDYITPNLSLCKDNNVLHYESLKIEINPNPPTEDEDEKEEIIDYSKEYFTLEFLEDGQISFRGVVNDGQSYYSFNDSEWTEITSETTLNISSNDTLRFKGVGNKVSTGYIGTFFTIETKFNVKGNVMSLLYGDEFEGQTDLTSKEYAFEHLFTSCTTLVNASELILPATMLTDYCYSYMFDNCTSLVTAPALPATTLYESCYSGMFFGCTNLTNAPEFPSTTLASNCYYAMFYGCTSLVTVPELHATTLASSCYEYMFGSCSKLSNITMLATDISATSCLSNWVDGVSSSGTFTKHPQMTSLPSGVNGIPSNWTVVDYEEASPNLITFTIEKGTYQAIEGMTWSEWCDSEYNAYDVIYDSTNVIGWQGLKILNVKPSDVIVSNFNYVFDASDFEYQ